MGPFAASLTPTIDCKGKQMLSIQMVVKSDVAVNVFLVKGNLSCKVFLRYHEYLKVLTFNLDEAAVWLRPTRRSGHGRCAAEKPG